MSEHSTAAESQRAPRVYVEIGAGCLLGYSPEKVFDPQDVYIGVDDGSAHRAVGEPSALEGFAQIERRAALRYTHPPRRVYLLCDGGQTWIEGGAADEVLFANVFSDPLLADKISPKDAAVSGTAVLMDPAGEPCIDANRNYLQADLGEAHLRLLREGSRLIGFSGRIVVNSYLSPSIADHKRLGEWLEGDGFSVQHLTPHDPEWAAMAAGYTFTDRPLGGHKFLIATKHAA